MVEVIVLSVTKIERIVEEVDHQPEFEGILDVIVEVVVVVKVVLVVEVVVKDRTVVKVKVFVIVDR